MIVEFVRTSPTHEVTVTLVETSRDAYYMVGVDCIDPSTGEHVRASVISRHEEREAAIRHADRLFEIIDWMREVEQ